MCLPVPDDKLVRDFKALYERKFNEKLTEKEAYEITTQALRPKNCTVSKTWKWTQPLNRTLLNESYADIRKNQ